MTPGTKTAWLQITKLWMIALTTISSILVIVTHEIVLKLDWVF